MGVEPPGVARESRDRLPSGCLDGVGVANAGSSGHPQDAAAGAFLRLGGEDRRTKKNYRMIRMPNGQLIVLPSGILKTGLLRSQIRRAGFTEDQFKEAL